MQNGQIVEIMSVEDMRAMRMTHPYSRHLLEASLGYKQTDHIKVSP